MEETLLKTLIDFKGFKFKFLKVSWSNFKVFIESSIFKALKLCIT